MFLDGMIHGIAVMVVCFIIGYALYAILFDEKGRR